MASGPITSWQKDGDTVTHYILSSRIPAMVTTAMKLKDACSYIKGMTNLDNMCKSRDITLPTEIHLVKTVVFPVVLYGCESWTIKKAEHWRIDAFELWC